MKIQQRILQAIQNEGVLTRSQIDELIHGSSSKSYSRQYLTKILREMQSQGELIKLGSTRKARYALPSEAKQEFFFQKMYDNSQLEEHLVFEEVKQKDFQFAKLPENIQSILYYAFSEMMNNAIEHSFSKKIQVTIIERENEYFFEIRDSGIGVFRSVYQKKRLQNEIEAIQEILKGKTTTQPRAHSGEGIFFTSKIADVYTLESFQYQLRVDNSLPDIFVGELPEPVKGTRVQFQIAKDSSKHLSDVFREYQTDPEEADFNKTSITVKLYTLGTIHISRSQARRLLHNLEKFDHIVLDFEDVPVVGQAFVDEIFRVFARQYPQIVIEPIHMNEAVEYMVNRGRSIED